MEFVIVNCIFIVLCTVIWHVEIFSCPVAIKRKCKIQIILCLSKLSAAYSVVPVKFLLGKDHCGNNTHRHLGTYLWLDYWKIKIIFFLFISNVCTNPSSNVKNFLIAVLWSNTLDCFLLWTIFILGANDSLQCDELAATCFF